MLSTAAGFVSSSASSCLNGIRDVFSSTSCRGEFGSLLLPSNDGSGTLKTADLNASQAGSFCGGDGWLGEVENMAVVARMLCFVRLKKMTFSFGYVTSCKRSFAVNSSRTDSETTPTKPTNHALHQI